MEEGFIMNKSMYALLVACFATSAYAATETPVQAPKAAVEATETAKKVVLTQEQADQLIKNFAAKVAPKNETRAYKWLKSVWGFVKAHPYITAGILTGLVAVAANQYFAYVSDLKSGLETAVSFVVDKATYLNPIKIWNLGSSSPCYRAQVGAVALGAAELAALVGFFIYMTQNVEIEGDVTVDTDVDVVA